MNQARALVRCLTVAGRTVAVAESLTGGMVVDAIVAVPGASACLRGGVVAYATDVKAGLLGVPAALLDQGPVHPDVARAMACGARDLFGADYGVATTGVAGPDPQNGVAPGTYHVAVVGPTGGDVLSVSGASSGRGAVRREARDAAIRLAVHFICDAGEGTPGQGRGLSPS